MNQRIRDLRKQLGLTMEIFGEKVGVTKSAVSQIESGKSKPSSQLILSICREFKVSEEWLRDGVGEMFPPRTREQAIGEFMADVLADSPDSIRSVIVSGLSRLDAEDWEHIAEILNKLTDPQA